MLLPIALIIGLTFLMYSCTPLRRIVSSTLAELLSWGINSYLVWSNPICSLDGSRKLPTCPYQWPNGQGDVGKFLEGERNSSQWQNEHGRIYRIWSGFKSEIVLTHPDDVETVFRDSDKHLKAKNGNAGWLMGELLGSCVGLISGAQWRNVHSVFAVFFTPKSSVSYTPLILRAVERHFIALQKDGSLSRSTVHPVQDFRLLPFWIVAEVIYGELSEAQRERLQNLIPLRESIFMRMLQGGSTRFWWSRYLPHSVTGDLRTFQKKWKEFNFEVYQTESRRPDEGLISTLFKAISSEELSWEQLLQTLDEMLFANLDVTIGGLSWNLYFLAKHQDVQATIRDEILALKGAPDSDELWTKYLISPSTLLAFSILESARLRPVAPFSVPQSAPTGRNVGGYWIPAGVSFIIDTTSLNVRSSIWGGDSTQFHPTRFKELSSIATRYSYWRFGFGPRQCLGKYVTDLIIRATLARLLAAHQLSLPAGMHGERNAETWTSQPTTGIVCEKYIGQRS